MGLQFCWLCGINYSFPGYKGKHLDDDGTPPCGECLQELEAEDVEDAEDA